jgi:hypothetical protein
MLTTCSDIIQVVLDLGKRLLMVQSAVRKDIFNSWCLSLGTGTKVTENED